MQVDSLFKEELDKIHDELKNKKEYFVTLKAKKEREKMVEKEFEEKKKVILFSF